MIKRFLPSGLLGRFVLIVVLPVVILQIIAAVVFYERHLEVVARRMARAVAGDIAMVMVSLRRADGAAERQAVVDSATQHLNMSVTLRPGRGFEQVPLPGGDSPLEDLIFATLAGHLGEPFTLKRQADASAYRIRVGLEAGMVEVLVPFNRFAVRTAHIIFMWTFGAGALLLLIALLFLRNQIRPIRQLALAAERFGRGELDETLKPHGAAEVRLAASAFLRMRERLQSQIRQRTEMLAGVSHDLGTPLTRMRLQLALLKDDEAAAELRAEVAEMEEMVAGYLAFAKGAQAEAPVETDIRALLDEVVDKARKRGDSITLSANGEMRARLRPQALRRCLTNLIANAGRFGDHIWIDARRGEEDIVIAIDDDGPGIPAAAREDVFRPFFRLDESRNPETGGIGLGLAIARDSARGQGGDIVLDDGPRGGLRATVRLPV